MPDFAMESGIKRSEKIDQLSIFLGFDAAGADDDNTVGGKKFCSRFQNMVLDLDDFPEMFFIEAPEGIGAFAENSGIGTGHIRHNDIEFTGNFLRSGGDDLIIALIDLKIFPGAFLSAVVDIGGDDIAFPGT